MAKISIEEIQSFMNACEVNSLAYEGVVYVKNGKAFQDGEEIEVNWKKLWKEFVKAELGEY